MKRTLPKLHISVNQQVTKEQAAYNKAAGYYVTDKETPLLGTWAKKVMEITNCGKVNNETREEEYKRKNEAWPQDRDYHDLLIQSVANDLNVSTDQVVKMDEEIRKTECLDGFPIVWDNPTNDKVDAIIGDSIEIVGTGQSVLNPTDLLINNNHINQNQNTELVELVVEHGTTEQAGHQNRDRPSEDRGHRADLPKNKDVRTPKRDAPRIRHIAKGQTDSKCSRNAESPSGDGEGRDDTHILPPRLPRRTGGRKERTGTGQSPRQDGKANNTTDPKSIRRGNRYTKESGTRDALPKRLHQHPPNSGYRSERK